MKGLRAKTVLVTGGGGAIGGAICRRFAEEGANVLVADKDAVSAGKVAQSIDAKSLVFDISDYAAAKRADRSSAQLALILGDDELQAETVAVKPLRTEANQETILQSELAQWLMRFIEAN